jgi:hypothetical protein
MINRSVPPVPPNLSTPLQPDFSLDLNRVTTKLDEIINLLKRPPLVQNNTFTQSSGNVSNDTDLLRRLRNQNLEDLKAIADQISLF